MYLSLYLYSCHKTRRRAKKKKVGCRLKCPIRTVLLSWHGNGGEVIKMTSAEFNGCLWKVMKGEQFKFIKRSSMYVLIHKHKVPPENQFQCPDCQKEFKNTDHLEAHLQYTPEDDPDYELLTQALESRSTKAHASYKIVWHFVNNVLTRWRKWC